MASHGSFAGTLSPLKPNEYASWATFTPFGIVKIIGVAASAADRALPVWANPAASSSFSVCVTPAAPWSIVWLDAVVQLL